MLPFSSIYFFYFFQTPHFSQLLHDRPLEWMKRKKGTFMKSNSIIILFTTSLLGFISYILVNNATLSLLILLTGSIFFIISRKNNQDRKENLNIIRDENKLYFYLSDDLLFSVNLSHNQSIKETLRESIDREISTIKEMTRKICFINFKEDALLDELNSTLQLRIS